MPPKARGKKDKEEPQMGPGSTIRALNDVLKKMLIITEEQNRRKLRIEFTSVGFKLLPLEICKNEEIAELATELMTAFNRLKKLPGSIDALQNLKYLDMRSNIMKSIPSSLFRIPALEYVSLCLSLY